MSIKGGPNIVTENLVLHLDAADKNSYSGSGNTWTDLSGNGNNATMYGSVPLETDVVRCWNFATATGSYTWEVNIGFTFVSNMVTRTGDFTFSCWIKNPNSYLSQTSLFSNTGSGEGYRFGIALTGIYYAIGPPYTEADITFLSSLESSKWYNVVAVFKRSTSQMFLYLNGIYQRTGSMPANQTIMQNVTPPGIVRGGCCVSYTGKLAQFSVYNYDLSDLNIQQNYLATKARFGL